MHKTIQLLFILIYCSGFSQENYPFKHGEYLEYKIHYGPIVAGKAILEVDFEDENYSFNAEGKSTGLFNFFFKVRDYYSSTSTTDCLCPLYFKRDVSEGNYKKQESVFFNYPLNRAETTRDTLELPENTQDILSLFYYLILNLYY